MFFSKTKKQTEAASPDVLGLDRVSLHDGVVEFSHDRFRLSDVIVASVNKDIVPGDGIAGSALFKTREFEPDRGVVQKVYKVTFDDSAISLVDQVLDLIESAGGKVNKLEVMDSAFRKAFF